MGEKWNIVANELAGQYQDKLGAFLPITHNMYPSSPAVLEINNMTITSNIHHHLIKTYIEPQHMQYLQERDIWTDKTTQSITWKCLNLGLKRIDREILLLKFVMVNYRQQQHYRHGNSRRTTAVIYVNNKKHETI